MESVKIPKNITDLAMLGLFYNTVSARFQSKVSEVTFKLTAIRNKDNSVVKNRVEKAKE